MDARGNWYNHWLGKHTGLENTQDWSTIWNKSEERKDVKTELACMKEYFSQQPVLVNNSGDQDALQSLAALFGTQFRIVFKRAFQQYWRTPSYLYSKPAPCIFCVSLVISKLDK
jgi:ATP-binding cassette subfamily G (WHITE) protein 2 (PDR)